MADRIGSSGNNSDSGRDRYRDNDDVRHPAPPEGRSEVAPDTKFEARGDARDTVGNNARGTDAHPTGPSGNDKQKSRSDLPDQYDEDLARDNQRGREGEGMSDLEQSVRSGMAGFPDAGDDRHGWRSHARQGQAESPVELTHNEPPHRKEGHR
jgi:hypothetical protein